jgi:hypothetical protein
MATAIQIQTHEAFPLEARDSSHWLESTASPREEARILAAMVGKNGNSLESIRELIHVPPKMEQALRLYASRHPEDAKGIESVLRFRRRVEEEFERLCGAATPSRVERPMARRSLGHTCV